MKAADIFSKLKTKTNEVILYSFGSNIRADFNVIVSYLQCIGDLSQMRISIWMGIDI